MGLKYLGKETQPFAALTHPSRGCPTHEYQIANVLIFYSRLFRIFSPLATWAAYLLVLPHILGENGLSGTKKQTEDQKKKSLHAPVGLTRKICTLPERRDSPGKGGDGERECVCERKKRTK